MSPHIFDIYGDAVNTDELTDHLYRISDLRDKLLQVCNSASESAKTHFFTVTIPFESIDPLAALEVLGSDNEFQFYWEHPDENLSLAAGKEITRVRTNQRDRFSIVQKQLDSIQSRTVSFSSLTHSLSGLHYLGGFSFHDQPQEHQWKSFGSSTFVIPEWLLLRDGQLSLLTITSTVNPGTDSIQLWNTVRNTIHDLVEQILVLNRQYSKNGADAEITSPVSFDYQPTDVSKRLWMESIDTAKNSIKLGEFKKIVLAREVTLKLDREPSPTLMLNHLRNEYPTCYTFMIRMDKGSVFLGCTPEKLVALRSTFILTDGLAGTISRGKTATEDTILERRLLQSDKDLVEHGFVVEAIGSRLKEITHNINFPEQPGIRKYTNVQHLYTPITASLNKNVTPLQIIEKLHPTPAVGGHPREMTLQHIQNLEKIDRGWYAGPVGWLNSNGRGEFCVAIRSGLIQQNVIRFYAGCGIVSESDPESEWNETNLKLIPMLSALAKS